MNRLPINVAAHLFLKGYVPEEWDQLHILTLLEVWVDQYEPRSLRRRGMPTAEEVRSVCGFLKRADPGAVLRYLTHIGEREVLTAAELEQSDGGFPVLDVLVSQLLLGASLPQHA